MTFVALLKPNAFEKLLVFFVQLFFWHFYFFIYIFFPKTAHRLVGYFEEEAVYSYTQFLKEIDAGNIENVPAPRIAIDYWHLEENATLRDVVIAIGVDEESHRDANHKFADNYNNLRQEKNELT